MMSQSVERLLPYGPERLFDLAADVERYPEFLRWWIKAQIRKREADVYYTDQVLGLGPVRVSFGSKTVLRRPERIDVTSDEPPFRWFHLSWRFASLPDGGCQVRLAADVDFRSHLLQRLVDRILPATIDEIIASFERRAHRLYADPPLQNAR
jgi:coenzyme Q-binding protein COQ10